MNISRSLRRPFLGAFFCATIILSCALTARAEPSPELLKVAGSIALTKDLLAHTRAFVQKVTDDAAVKAEFAKIGGEKDMTPENANTVVAKYPKLDAAFKSSSLKPEDFMKVWGAMIVIEGLVEVGAPVDDKAVKANLDFYNANKEDVKALSQAIEGLQKTTASPAPSP